MIRTAVIACSVFLLFSCNSNKENFKVTGNLTGGTGKMIFLKEMTVSKLIPVDSVILDETGSFSLGGYTDIIKFYAFYVDPGDMVTLLIRPGDKIKISGKTGDLSASCQVEGSEDSRSIRELSAELNKTLEGIKNLSKVFNDSLKSPDFEKIKARLDNSYKEIVSSHRDFTFRFIREHIQSPASLMALYQQIGVRTYLLDPVKDFSWYQMVDSSLIILYPGSEAVQELHRQVMELTEQKRMNELALRRFEIGSEVPEISLPSPEGDTISLSSLKGKYVLLDFWASWCGPCRAENPRLVTAYQKYNSKGFEIFQVSLDRTREAWVKAIEDDHLTWIHVSDLKYWNSVVVTVYNIQGIPANLLLDPQGRIIDQNLRGERLNAKLEEIFND